MYSYTMYKFEVLNMEHLSHFWDDELHYLVKILQPTPRSCDLTSSNFFFGGFIKSL